MVDDNQQEPKQELSEKEKQNAQILAAFQMNLIRADQLTLQMSSRQLARVMRSLLKAPLAEPEKFVDNKEKELYNLGMRVADTKMLLVLEHQKQIEKSLKEVTEKAKEMETKGEENV